MAIVKVSIPHEVYVKYVGTDELIGPFDASVFPLTNQDGVCVFRNEIVIVVAPRISLMPLPEGGNADIVVIRKATLDEIKILEACYLSDKEKQPGTLRLREPIDTVLAMDPNTLDRLQQLVDFKGTLNVVEVESTNDDDAECDMHCNECSASNCPHRTEGYDPGHPIGCRCPRCFVDLRPCVPEELIGGN